MYTLFMESQKTTHKITYHLLFAKCGSISYLYRPLNNLNIKIVLSLYKNAYFIPNNVCMLSNPEFNSNYTALHWLSGSLLLLLQCVAVMFHD